MFMAPVAGVARATPATNFRQAAAGIAPVAMVVGIGVLLSGQVPETAFLAFAAAFGLPHGALDHLVGQRAFGARYGILWWRPFLVGYLTLIAATLLIWWTLPSVALLSFLCLSLLHFGDEDAIAEAPRRLVRVLAHGGSVIIVPAVSHPAIVERLFAVLAPAHAHVLLTLLSGPLALAWTVAIGATLVTYVGRGSARDWSALVNLILVVMLFAVVTPLIAFSLYFAAIHTPRALATALPSDGRDRGTLAIPIMLTLLGLAFGAAIFLAGSALPVDIDIVRSTFLLLSALTVPHMWLERQTRQL